MKRLWTAFILVVLVSFGVLGWAGMRIYQEKPPLPESIATPDGTKIIPDGYVVTGQSVWQAMGGMELGSIWGHGSYVAPDWTADWLHRECVFILNDWANADFTANYDNLSGEQQAALRERLKELMRKNTYDPATGWITLEPIRARAFAANVQYYQQLFTQGKPEYAIPVNTLTDTEKITQLASFFFWTSWAASTNRPGQSMSYTSNWPHEPLIDNNPTADSIIWTGFSIIMLLAGIGLMVWYHARAEARARGRADSANRSALRFQTDAVAEGDRQILLDRGRSVSPPDAYGGDICTLRCRGKRLLRHTDRQMDSVSRSCAPGTPSSASSGSLPPGLRRGCLSGQPSVASNSRARDWV